MQRCPACGQENPDGFRFCGACGTRLAAPAAAGGQERKVVTVLFCDLVGFTARSDRADPEDVGALLRPYHQRLRAEIERLGGTLDKFIGDGVMAVFGAPAAHEDDPERAVRCALRMLDAIEALNRADPARRLSVRIGVTTGEALVTAGAVGQTEAVVGDVVNTASRLQGVAPAGGAVVGEATWRATAALFDYQRLEPVAVKGKRDPLPVWRLLGARARTGVDARRPATPLVGRDGELARLEAGLELALRGRTVRLALLTGEPGVGKSRLVRELAARVDARPELVTWRQGRCLPYGDGITFWALGEIVKAQAGIRESDGAEQVAAKLDAAVAALAADPPEREWLAARLAPLLGLDAGAPAAADREELFTAWRRFVEAIAAAGPLVLAVEDLHWADPALLGFLEHLLDHAAGVPLQLLVTARPELEERHPGWPGERPNADTVALAPLSDAETARLVGALLHQAVLPAEVQAPLLERAGGNPLYAEEFVRLLADRGLLRRRGRHVRLHAGAEIPFPDSVQALIAARLDALPPARKALLQQAAVLGRTFWPGGLAALSGRDEADLGDDLRALGRAELVRAAPASSVAGQAEYAFWHALVRDVAYGQITRPARARHHRAAAEWLARLAGPDAAGPGPPAPAGPQRDLAEVIAHHYGQALRLARACGEPATELAALEAACRRYLVLAGDRALPLDVGRARAYYDQALALFPADHPDLPAAQLAAGRAAFHAGALPDAAAAYRAAIEGLRRGGDRRRQGMALDRLATVLWNQGDGQGSRAAQADAIELLEREPPGPERCTAYSQMAIGLIMSGHPQEALGWADKALALADALGGLADVRVRALDARGMARCDLGDLGGADDLRAALALGLESGAGYDTAVVYNNLAEPVWLADGPAAALRICQEGIEFAERRGITEGAAWLRSSTVGPLYDLGRWDEALRRADQALAWDRDHGGRYLGVGTLRYRAQVLRWRGEVAAAAAVVAELLPPARELADLQVLVPALVAAAEVELAAGRPAAAVALVEELAAATEDRSGGLWYRGQHLAELVRVCAAADAPALARALLDGGEVAAARHRHARLAAQAALAEAGGDRQRAADLYRDAAAAWAGYGQVLEQALALLGAGRCARLLGRPEAAAPLEAARGLLAGLRARPLLGEADGWLAGAAAETS